MEKSLPFTTNELFRLLCFEYRVIDVEYFLDKMDVNECVWILRNLAFTDRNQWEMTRLKIYSTVSMFSKGRLKPDDIIKFPWDKENIITNETEERGMSLTEEERKEVEKGILGILNGNSEINQ